jgi:hypothetical protein
LPRLPKQMSNWLTKKLQAKLKRFFCQPKMKEQSHG